MFSFNVLFCLAPMLFDGFAALKVVTPSQTDIWNLQDSNTVTWTSVDTDPKNFDIVLVNNNPNCAPTGMKKVIKENVSSTDGKYDVGKLASVKACGGYQINLVATSSGSNSNANNQGILAQSAPFTVTDNSAPGTAQPSPKANLTASAQPSGSSSVPTTQYSAGVPTQSNSSVDAHTPAKLPNDAGSSALMSMVPFLNLIATAALHGFIFGL